jgi:F0F1-type ATP synthase membrane subunit b/b'
MFQQLSSQRRQTEPVSANVPSSDYQSKKRGWLYGPFNKEKGTQMMDDDKTENIPRNYSGALLAAIAVALVAALGGLIWSFTLNSRLSSQQSELADAKQQNVNLQAKLRETDARLKVATEELGNSLGLTQKQLETRAQEILAREQADATRLSNAQKKTAQQVNEVSGEVSSVKTDVGGIKTNVAKTQSDLADTVTQLTSMKGDLSEHSSLIARNHDELEILKHKGDRTYYEFTLTRGQKKPVGTVSLLLKKADPKKNNFNLEVTSDDKTVMKNNRGLDEPLQFYSGKDPLLFEIVVNAVNSKNQVTGYLAVPTSAPAPPTVQ